MNYEQLLKDISKDNAITVSDEMKKVLDISLRILGGKIVSAKNLQQKDKITLDNNKKTC